MSAAHGCDKLLLVQAELDGELDAAAAASLTVHREQCSVCRAASEELNRARALFSGGFYQPMPDELRARITAQMAAAASGVRTHLPRTVSFDRAPWHRWWASATSFGLGAACAAAITLLVLAPGADSLTEQIVAGHIRSLQPGHLEDVPSSDRHTVKPWFDGRIDFAPPVKDLAGARFPLKGGRLDYLGGRPVAALIYQRDKHIINLFIWPTGAGAEALPKAADRQGYNVVHWIANGMTFWAVSDLEANQLRDFVEEWRQSP